MIPKRLPDNVRRCYDAGCPQRMNCRRWLERDTARACDLPSLFPYDTSLGKPCPLQIPEEGGPASYLGTEHWDQAARIVESWPQWKRDIGHGLDPNESTEDTKGTR